MTTTDDQYDGPDVSDGCDKDGFQGGCERAGHKPENCPGFQIGDTVRFAARHIAAGDYGVIVARECWLNNHEAVAWDGVGEIPARVKRPHDYSVQPEQLGRFLVRLMSINESSDPAIGGLGSWRERCLQWPHSYPYCIDIDLELVSRPNIKRLNDTDCLGLVIGQDARQSLVCISDSEAGARKAIADMKAASGLALKYPKSDSDSKTLNFFCQEVTETKVADQISVGFKFWMSTLFGIRAAEVIAVDEEAGSADTKVGGHQGLLKRKDDGWYDQHILFNPDMLARVKFAPDAEVADA
jgi:hypothetical protein